MEQQDVRIGITYRSCINLEREKEGKFNIVSELHS